ncbi:MAG: MgtC/SapB family protein [Patescibacteria group bacterium]
MNDYISNEFWLGFQVLVAILLGAILGWQRKSWGKSAGPRTYALVTGGSALFTILARAGFGSLAGGSGIAAGIVTGIGFLGAGLIFHREEHIDGLTTAAGLWASAAIGMAVGTSHYILAILTTVLVLVVLALDDERLHTKNTRLLKKD